MKKDERFLYYAEDFTKKLEKTTRKLIDNASAVFIGNHEALRDLIYSESGIIRGQYVIVAADEKIETEIRDILKNEDV